MHHRRAFIGLAHDQRRGCGQFVGHRHLGHLQGSALTVGAAPQVGQAGQTAQANGHAHGTQPPRPTVGIDDQHAEPRASSGFHLLPQPRGRGVGVFRQKEHPFVVAFYVGMVDARVGAHKTQAVLHDEHTGHRAQDPAALLQNEFHQTRVLAGEAGQGPGPQPGPHRGQMHVPPLGFGHDFLGHHQDVAILYLQAGDLQTMQDVRGQVVAGAHLGDALQGGEGQRCHSPKEKPRGTVYAPGPRRRFTFNTRYTRRHSTCGIPLR